MLYVDIPTLPEFKALATTRADPCVSIHLPTTPLTQGTGATRAQLKNLGKAALDQLDDSGFDKRRPASIEDHLAEFAEDDDFWRFQAHSLAVLVTPDTMRTFRLPNRLTPIAEVSDRFHLKPLLRAITFPHVAFGWRCRKMRRASSRCSPTCRRDRLTSRISPEALPTRSDAPRSTTVCPAGVFRDRRGRRFCCANTRGESMRRCARF
jgi:hypothetical protein